MKWVLFLGLICGLFASPSMALASSAVEHGAPIAPLLLGLTIILITSKLGGDLVSRLGQPAVLGELLIGVLLGGLGTLGFSHLEGLKTDGTIDTFAQLGVLVLLFEVGLESTVTQMLRVGLSSLLVAFLGVLTPFFLGWGMGVWLLPLSSPLVHVFLGATLCATSVGITARVLQEIGRAQSDEARIILGAAVVDDVLGLVILAVVSGIIAATNRGGTISCGAILAIVGKAAGFLVGAIVLGVLVSRRLFHVASRLRTRGVLLATGLGFCFLLSWLSSLIGLAPIVGAFAAGLVLEDVHFRDFMDRGEHSLEELIQPISSFLVPIFFVLMGMRTDVRVFADWHVLGLAVGLTLAAVVGKQACSLGVIGPGMDRISVGIGMIPRGEVGLIFANIGRGLTIHGTPVVDATTYSAIMVMVIVTTLVTPPVLKWSMLRRGEKERSRHPR